MSREETSTKPISISGLKTKKMMKRVMRDFRGVRRRPRGKYAAETLQRKWLEFGLEHLTRQRDLPAMAHVIKLG